MNISELFGKKIVSTQGKVGYIISVYGGAGRVECLLCADAEENEFTVDVKNIVSLGEKVIYEDRESAIKSAKPLRLGRAVFDEKGIYIGDVEDYIFAKDKPLKAKIGKKNYPAEGLVCGDVVIVKNTKRLKSDVLKNGKVIIKKGTSVTSEVLLKARENGEYVQTNLKSI
ncbi:MAG: hypothetical protein K2L42_06455 [Clostridia bacterium]|nr:hypothetical protein [Clostridia bacterium]